MAVFSTNERKRRPRGDRKSSELSIHLRQALMAAIKTELYPWSQIDVYVEVLHADGGNDRNTVDSLISQLIYCLHYRCKTYKHYLLNYVFRILFYKRVDCVLLNVI